jgi:hypothetical protein
VVFVDHARWWAFTQLAAVVRRSGGRAVRVSVRRPGWRTRLADRLLFDRSIYLAGPGALASVVGLLAGEKIVDVQCTEYVCGQLAEVAAAGLPDTVGAALLTRAGLLDKFAVGEMAGARGVRTPAKLAAHEVSVGEAVARFGLPLVVKARVGAAGDGVRIARTAAQAERALEEIGPDRSRLFFEQLVIGEDIDYSAVISAEGVVLDVGTRTVGVPPGSTTPPSAIEILDAPQLLEFGRRAAEKLGFAGLAHLDTVRDAEGRYWLIDLNLRAWGSMIPSRATGIDFASAYLYSIGMRCAPPMRGAVTEPAAVTVFPRVVDDALARNRRLEAVVAFVRRSGPYLRWLGVRYWLSELLRLADGLAATRRR